MNHQPINQVLLFLKKRVNALVQSSLMLFDLREFNDIFSLAMKNFKNVLDNSCLFGNKTK